MYARTFVLQYRHEFSVDSLYLHTVQYIHMYYVHTHVHNTMYICMYIVRTYVCVDFNSLCTGTGEIDGLVRECWVF